MIELKNIDVIFNKGSKIENHVLKDISLKVMDGQFVTVIGGNGAGKSTLMNLLAGDVIPTSGTVLIDGEDVTGLSGVRRASLVARVFQDPMIGTFANLTIEENMCIAYKRGKCRGFTSASSRQLREKFTETLSMLDMGLENRLTDIVASLSGGQRQALSLIMATLQGSKILLLDEHTSALDPKIARSIMEITDRIVKKHRLTTMMITHSMTQALEHGDRTIMMYHGEVIRDMQGESRVNLSPDDLIKYFDL